MAARATPTTVLDVGTGTGSLARAAAARWPDARVVGLDASAAMLSVARHGTRSGGRGPGMGRLEWLVADAAAMPLESASVDVVVCAFMLHLAVDRRAVLREVGRILRPAGTLGLVTWLADDAVMAPDAEFDEAVYDLGLDDPEAEAGPCPSQEIGSPEELRDDLVAAGFEDVDVQPDRLEHAWTREAYLDFKSGYDEWDLVDSLSSGDQERLRERLADRWAFLPDEAFRLRAPLVMAMAGRPAAR